MPSDTTDSPDRLCLRLSLHGDEKGEGDKDELELGESGESTKRRGGSWDDAEFWTEILCSTSNTSSGGMLGGLSVIPLLLLRGDSVCFGLRIGKNSAGLL